MTDNLSASGTAPPDVLDTPRAGRQAIRGSAIRTLGYVAGTLLTLASAPLLVRHLGVIDFGRYFTVVALVGLVGGVTDVGLGAIALREYSARGGEDRDDFMKLLLGARLALTVGGVLVATAFAAAAGYGADLVAGTLLAGLGLVASVVGHTYSVPLSAQLRQGRLAAIELGGRALGVALVVLLVLLGAGVVAFLAVAIPASLAMLLGTVALTRGSVPLSPSFDRRKIQVLLRDTLPLAAATILSTLYSRVVIIAMSLIATKLATGYFGTASRVVEAGIGIPLSLLGAVSPIFARAARDDEARLRYVVQRVGEVALIGGTWLALVAALGARGAAHVLVDDPGQVRPVADVLRILGSILVLVFVSLTLQTALVSLKRHRSLLAVNGVALAVILLATPVFVLSFGAPGGAIAVVTGELAVMGGSAAALRRALPGLGAQLQVVPKVLLATAVAVLLALAWDLPDVTRLVLASAAYFAALFALRAIPTELYGALRTEGDAS